MFLAVSLAVGGGVALLGRQQAIERERAEQAAQVEEVGRAIERIGVVDIDARGRVEEARGRLEALDPTLRARVHNADAIAEADRLIGLGEAELGEVEGLLDAARASGACPAIATARDRFAKLPLASQAHVADYSSFQALVNRCIDEERIATRNTLRLIGDWEVSADRRAGTCTYRLRPRFTNLTDITWSSVTFDVEVLDGLDHTLPGSRHEVTVSETIAPHADHRSRAVDTFSFECRRLGSNIGVFSARVTFADGRVRALEMDDLQVGPGWTR
ncbi:hypothetical protein G7070_08905 [Propioniciclava coleopterorum]|uniref:Uncharacterized protein n=1 Tax=Propioniciclava coleopterorum TaxID=2714937 RepID=A0A6G7Y6Q7_9ACTN|nr:hypothetical protein [Propioniciclava coleopterorum]QIK72366.1 hypothetical protein G7070_08905 [Propioniciclava coleopterorum]